MSSTIPSNTACRVNYQDGMFLTAHLMATEQSYFVNTIALQNSMLYTPGVLSGLSVSQTGGNALSVEAGGGFDGSGNFLILPSGGGNALTVPTTAANPSLVYLVFPTAAQQTQNMPPGIVNMAGVPTLAAAGAAAPANSILLAQIGLNDQGVVVSVTDKRVPVTSRLGSSLDGLTLASAPVPQSNAQQGTVTVPVDQLPTGDKPFVTTVYFNEQHAPAFASAPKVVTQVMGALPYPTSVGDPTATTHFVLTIAASSVTPSSVSPLAELRVSWWAFT